MSANEWLPATLQWLGCTIILVTFLVLIFQSDGHSLTEAYGALPVRTKTYLGVTIALALLLVFTGVGLAILGRAISGVWAGWSCLLTAAALASLYATLRKP